MGFKTQAELGAKLGVDQPMIARWETGIYYPSEDYRGALKSLLQVDDSFFIDEPHRNTDQLAEMIKRIESLESQLQKPKGAKSELISLIDSLDEPQAVALTGVIKKWLSLRGISVKKDEIGS